MTPEMGFLLAGLLLGTAVFLAGWWLWQSVLRPAPPLPVDPTYAQRRRAQLAEVLPVWRHCGQWLAARADAMPTQPTAEELVLEEQLAASGNTIPWTAREMRLTRQLEGILTGVAIGTFAGVVLHPFLGVFSGAILAVVYYMARIGEPANLALVRIKTFKQRLPFAIDLVALMMEAGSDLRQALRTVGRIAGDTPLGAEFNRLLSELDLGKTLPDTLRGLQARTGNDPDVTELVFAIITGTELGTPLVEVFRTQAAQMRLKRSQWIEKAAAVAQVRMSLPGLVVMLACLLVVVGPFLLKLLNDESIGAF